MANRRLFVGNLPFSMQDDDLGKVFDECGTVESAKVILDRQTNRSRGFGFVEMASEDEVRTAIERLDGIEVDGRNLRVSEATEKKRDNRR